MLVTPSPRLAVVELDTPYPIKFPGPYSTVAFVLERYELGIYVERAVHPLDWDITLALMDRIANRERRKAKAPSALKDVNCWDIVCVPRSVEYLI